MKEKLMNVCGKLLFAAFVVFFFWGAVEMFRQGAWISCTICVMGVLLFGGPLVVSRISSPAVSESVPLVSQIDLPTDKDSLRKLAKLVAGEEADVMQTVEQLLESPEAFYSAQTMRDGEYKGEYCEIWEFYHDKPDLLYSEGLRFVLEEAKVIAMFDWKEALEEFVGQMTDLRRVQAHNLPVPQEHFDELADIPHWCNALNELWQPLGYNVMFIDTKGDEYLVAVVQYTPSPPIDDISCTTQS
ncbi:MAG: DUF6630 family protein [Prevotella sp.]|jgi:hypothetical protein